MDANADGIWESEPTGDNILKRTRHSVNHADGIDQEINSEIMEEDCG